MVKSPKLSFALSCGRCRPGLTGIFRRYPLFSESSRQKKPRNVTFLGFVYVGFYADLKGDDLFVRFKLGRLTVFDAADGIQHLIVVLLRLGVVVPGVLVLEDHM